MIQRSWLKRSIFSQLSTLLLWCTLRRDWSANVRVCCVQQSRCFLWTTYLMYVSQLTCEIRSTSLMFLSGGIEKKTKVLPAVQDRINSLYADWGNVLECYTHATDSIIFLFVFVLNIFHVWLSMFCYLSFHRRIKFWYLICIIIFKSCKNYYFWNDWIWIFLALMLKKCKAR